MDGKGRHLGSQSEELARGTTLANDEGFVIIGGSGCFAITEIVRDHPDLGRHGNRNARHDRNEEEKSKLTQVSHEISPVPKARIVFEIAGRLMRSGQDVIPRI